MSKENTSSNIIKENKGLFGNLVNIMKYYNIEIKRKLVSQVSDNVTQEKLYCLIIDYPNRIRRPATVTAFARSDTLVGYIRKDLKDKLDKEDGRSYLEYLKENIIEPDDIEKKRIDIDEYIIEALKAARGYCIKTEDKEEIICYDIESKNSLIDYIKLHTDSLCYILYLYIYFAVHNKNPSNFYYGPRADKDLKEFNNEVICKYGVTTNAGARSIISLATKDIPNIFAMYEYAEMFYSGMNSASQSYTKAFEWYFKAAGLATPTKDNFKNGNLKKISGSFCNPLALWSISNMMWYYKTGYLDDCEEISYIEDLYDDSKERRDELIIYMAIYYAYKSFSLNDTGAASNLLGNILNRLENDELKYYKELLKNEDGIELKEPVEYYKLAMEKKYVYAFNNYASIIIRNSNFKLPEQKIKEYIHLLDESTTLIDTWALNRLGLYYLNGEIIFKDNGRIVKCKDYTAPINREKAKAYFQRAIQTYIDYGSVWACYNLLFNFSDYYNSDEEEFQIICRKILEYENSEAYKKIYSYFLNESCPYSDHNKQFFRKISKIYLNRKKLNNESDYYDVIIKFCEFDNI